MGCLHFFPAPPGAGAHGPKPLDPGPGTYCSSLGGSNPESKIGSEAILFLCLPPPNSALWPAHVRKQARVPESQGPQKAAIKAWAGRWASFAVGNPAGSLDRMSTHNPLESPANPRAAGSGKPPRAGSAAADKGNEMQN